MDRTYLVAGPATGFSRQLAASLVEIGARALLATEDEAAGEEAYGLPIEWNRRSPLSARSVLLECYNRANRVDEALVVLVAPLEPGVFQNVPTARCEELIDAAIKGTMFLTRELLRGFEKTGAGTVTYVLFDGAEVKSPLDAAICAAFRAFATGLFAYFQDEPVIVRGLYSDGSEADAFLKFVLETLRERPERSQGRWMKPGGRPGLFGFSKK